MRALSFASLRSLFAITDEQAMWRVQHQDDEQAFAQLVRRWEGPIQRLCTRMTGDLHRGEDLAQETFARVFSHRGAYDPAGRFGTWIWRIALNLCYDELRRRQRRDELLLEPGGGDPFATLDAFEAAEPAPDKSLIDRERGELVRHALMRLPEIYRTVLVLRHYQDLKFREIADILAVPEGTVKSRVAEGLSLLERWLRPDLHHNQTGENPLSNASSQSISRPLPAKQGEGRGEGASSDTQPLKLLKQTLSTLL